MSMFLLAALLLGCGDKPDDTEAPASSDGGASDGGASDGGTSDGGTSDGGTSDGGASDGGTGDGGTGDGGTSDGGASDGGTSDGGTSDGGSACTDTEAVCGNGADDDCDGLIDCEDADCIDSVACGEDCTNGGDDDGDGLIDCDDADCPCADGTLVRLRSGRAYAVKRYHKFEHYDPDDHRPHAWARGRNDTTAVRGYDLSGTLRWGLEPGSACRFTLANARWRHYSGGTTYTGGFGYTTLQSGTTFSPACPDDAALHVPQAMLKSSWGGDGDAAFCAAAEDGSRGSFMGCEKGVIYRSTYQYGVGWLHGSTTGFFESARTSSSVRKYGTYTYAGKVVAEARTVTTWDIYETTSFYLPDVEPGGWWLMDP